MTSKYFGRAAGLVVLGALAVGCGSKPEEDQGKSFHGPRVAPIVAKATPAALRPPTTARWILRMLGSLIEGTAHAAPVTVDEAIKKMFDDPVVKISGGSAQGLINASIEDLDSRIAESSGMKTRGKCLDGPARPHAIDLSSASPSLKLILQVQCNRHDSVGLGGVVLGQAEGGHADAAVDDAGTTLSGGNYSLWLDLGANGPDKFGYFANVTGYGTPAESADFLFLADGVSTNRVTAYRVKATPGTNTFEVAYASTNSGGITLECGFQMISDGIAVWATGKQFNLATGIDCTTAPTFANCYKATDLSPQPDTNCDTLKTAFTMQPVTNDQLGGATAQIDAALAIASADADTIPW